jgi:hypothetical protein
VLVAGAGVVLLVILFFGMLGGVRALLAGDARRYPVTPARVDTVTTRLLRRYGSPAFAAGLRIALGVRSGRAARGTLLAAVIAVTVAVTALVFAASFRYLTQTPRLYGQTWDYETFGAPDQVQAIRRDPGVTALAAAADDTLTVNRVDTGVRGWNDLEGRVAPTITRGRAPHSPDEIALGTKTLRAAGADVGGYVKVRGRGSVRRMHVVGRAVLPSSKSNKLGFGAVMTLTALKQSDGAGQPLLFLIRLAPGAAGRAATARLDAYFEARNEVIRPEEVGDFGRIDNMPLYIALLAGLTAAIALAHALVAGVRRSRHDLAILKTLGFTRAQVAAAVAWQATAIVAVGVVIGVPLGLAIGRFTWRLFANDLGVAPEVVAPALAVALVLPVALIVANTVAAVPGWLAARIRPAPVLRTE